MNSELQRWLVCGGREFTDNYELSFFNVMDGIVGFHGKPGLVIHGGCVGIDTLAGKWAKSRGIPVTVVPADWAKHGRAAGPIRNQQMLDEKRPEMVIAFQGGNGTKDMVDRARKAGVHIMHAHVVNINSCTKTAQKRMKKEGTE